MSDQTAATLSNVSVVVPTRNRGEVLAETLRRIMRTNPAPFELIVVDQSNPSEQQSNCVTVQEAARMAGWSFSCEKEKDPLVQPGRLRLVQSNARGAGRARNTGARLASQALVLFTDDDTFPEPDWVGVMSAEFKQPEIWAVYGRILPYDADGKANGNGVEVVRSNLAYREFSQPTWPWYLGSGANMAFRRSFLDMAAGLDEVLSIGAKFRAFEDIDIGYRALIFGGKVVYTPASLVYHNSQKTFAEQLKTEQGYGISTGAAVVKYWRCGDKLARSMLLHWIWQMGVRRAGAGLLKWRNPKVIQLALLQFWWPLVGVWQAYKQPLDHTHWLFKD
jgi:GT2 family glycosyltransferase